MDGFLDDKGRWKSPHRNQKSNSTATPKKRFSEVLRVNRDSGSPAVHAESFVDGQKFMDGFMDDRGKWKSDTASPARREPERFRPTTVSLLRAIGSKSGGEGTAVAEVRRIIRQGVDLNAFGADGYGPLHAAAIQNEPGVGALSLHCTLSFTVVVAHCVLQIVKSLVQAQAALDIQGHTGLTPLDMALRKVTSADCLPRIVRASVGRRGTTKWRLH